MLGSLLYNFIWRYPSSSAILKHGAEIMKEGNKMSKKDLITETTRLNKELESLQKFLESKHKEYVSRLMLVDMMRKKEVNKATA